MTTPEHKVAMHQLATERRNRGLQSWKYRIDLSGVWDRESFNGTDRQHREAIAGVITRSAWVASLDTDHDVHMLLEEMYDSDTDEEFNFSLDQVYDYADYDRCWINLND